ncbi:MAG: hypothetical protein ABIR96_07720 [Bdellovibrionota bacterium]
MSHWTKKFTLSSGALFLVLALASPLQAASNAGYPETPDLKMTPGATCEHPDSFRYPEHVPYCSRAVKSDTKWAIIRDYDQVLGFRIESMDRKEFKIDHLIPLCMGGSNETTNLWPQYKAIYELTDPLEPALCGRMAEGKMSQVEAMDFIRRAKQSPQDAPKMLKELLGSDRR